MSPHFEILCIGHQRQLMAVRVAVLRMEGYCVTEAYTTDDAFRILASSYIDIVVICHSIPTQSRRRLALAIKGTRPLTPVIALHEAFDYINEADLSVDQLAGPETLLEAIASLLKKPAHRAALHAESHNAKSTS